MTDKEIARFKVKFPKINLSKERLAAYKLSLAEDADDATIDAKLDEVNGIFPFDEIAKADDRARTPPKPTPTPTPTPANEAVPADDELPADTPAWAKALIGQTKTLADKVAGLENGKTVETRRSQLDKALEGASDGFKKLTVKAFDRMNFKDDEEFNSYLEEVKTDAGEFKQNEADTSMSGFKAPVQSKGDTSKQASKEDVQAIFGKPKA